LESGHLKNLGRDDHGKWFSRMGKVDVTGSE